jgi:tRNA-2-methylthio-N6-dimethylallyladenosine synthase
MPQYHVTTFGCQINEHDSERMKGMLESLGYDEADDRENADLILFNTCSIRETADSRLIGHLGEAKRIKTANPDRVIGVGGCWAQSVKDEVFERSYCIVPSTRGREVSRDPNELIKEIAAMADEGVREVTLLGQNVNSYGRELPKESRISFAQLLREVDAIDGIDRIRYTSPHPKDMKEDVLTAHAELPALCEHIHLPLQAGSSEILKAMKRTYNRERYMDRVKMIRELVPDCSISTDIIVGFPGETEEDFQQTLDVVEEVRYDSAFTFIFSPRRGTVAADLPNHITHPVKRERMGRLVEMVQAHAAERAQRFIGREVEVLVEGHSRTDPTKVRGRTRHNKVINFGGLAKPGEMTHVNVLSATSQTLAGEESLLARAIA